MIGRLGTETEGRTEKTDIGVHEHVCGNGSARRSPERPLLVGPLVVYYGAVMYRRLEQRFSLKGQA